MPRLITKSIRVHLFINLSFSFRLRLARYTLSLRFTDFHLRFFRLLEILLLEGMIEKRSTNVIDGAAKGGEILRDGRELYRLIHWMEIFSVICLINRNICEKNICKRNICKLLRGIIIISQPILNVFCLSIEPQLQQVGFQIVITLLD